MKNPMKLLSFALAAVVPLACTTTDPARVADATGAYPDRIDAFGQPVTMGPAERGSRGASPRSGETVFAAGPVFVDLADVPAQARPDWVTALNGPAGKRSHAPGPVSEKKMAELRERARQLPPNARAQQTRQANIGDVIAGAPAAVGGFDGPDSADCCGGSGVSVPPDPEMAAGLNHVIAAVNSAFAIYDKSGNEAAAPRTFEDFFSGFPECQGTFDPNVIYDESADRFFLAIVGNGNGTHYCMAVSETGDPTGGWNQFSLRVDVGGNFFDFPHAGIGAGAIFMGANMFGASYEESIIWAIDKNAMYNGQAPAARSFSVGWNFTPQPMNLHGDIFPAANDPHYFIANFVDTATGNWYADEFMVWSWTDPFEVGNPNPVLVGPLSLAAASPITAGFPVEQPQQGGRRAHILDGGDWRVQDAEYNPVNGNIVMAHTVSCNPGGGTVNCVRWAEVNPAMASVVDLGMVFSSGEFRSYADAAVNACGDIAIGYTKTSGSTYPGIWAAAREDGVDSAEFQLKAGETTYSSFQNWRQPTRWGDYTGMTIDPDGETFWYLGEYAKNSGLSTNWGTYISSFKLDSCGGGGPINAAPVVAISAPADGSSFDAGLTVSFAGSASDAEDGNLTGGLAWTSSLDGPIGSGAGFTTSALSVGAHTVTASVSDSGGRAGSDTVNVTINDTGNGGLTITSAVGTKQRGLKVVSLNWNGTDGAGNVTVTRDGGAPVTTADDGSYTDETGEKGGGTYLYEICEEGTANCDSVSVVF